MTSLATNDVGTLEVNCSPTLLTTFPAALAPALDLWCVLGTDRELRYLSPALATCLGYTTEDPTGQPLLALVHPDDQPLVHNALEQLRFGQQNMVSAEARCRCLNEEFKHFEWQFAISAEGHDTYALARDVTRQRRVEQQLHRSNALLEALSKAHSLAIMDEDPHGLFSELLHVLLGLSKSQFGFIGEVLYESDGTAYLKTHAISDLAWDDATRELYDKRTTTGLEFRNLKTLFGAVITSGLPVIANDAVNDPRSGGLPSGHPPVKSFMGLPFYLAGEMLGMVAVANRSGGYDGSIVEFLQPLLNSCSHIIEGYRIDRRRRAYQERLAQMSAIVESSDDGIIGTDLDGRIVSWNAGADAVFGYTSAEVLGKSLSLLAPAAAVDHVQQLMDSMKQGQRVKHVDVVRRRKDGRTVDVSLTVSPVRNAKGELTGASVIARDVTERKLAEKQLIQANLELQRLASTDGLTGLANRRLFDQLLVKEWKRHRRSGLQIGLLLIDADCFKRYNDLRGHLAGDDCLKAIGRAVESQLMRPGDMAARYGGEEFAVILPETSLEGAEQVAQRICERVRQLHIAHPGSLLAEGIVTVSVGCISMVPVREEDVLQFVHQADQALYQAKAEGRDRVVTFQSLSPLPVG